MEIAAACITFVDFSYKLIDAVTRYAKSVKNCPQSCNEILLELHSYEAILQRMTNLCQQNPGIDLNTLETLVKVCVARLSNLVPLLEERMTMSASKVKKTRRARVAAVFRRLIWPLTESQFQGYLGSVRHYYPLIMLDLQTIATYHLP